MEPGQIDGGTPPSGTESTDSRPTRPGPLPLDGDSWAEDSAWLNGDAAVDETDRYHGRRRSKGTGSDYRWWIGGAAGLIASVAAIALIMTPSSGAGGSASSASSPGADAENADGLSATTAGELPVGGGSAPVGVPTAAGEPTDDQQPFAVTIEAESGSPMVILTGSAAIAADERASGGQIVTGVGNRDAGGAPGAIQIVGINLPGAGTFRFSIYYVNRDDENHSSAVIAVSGAEPTTVNFPGNKRCCGVRTIEVALAAGSHPITITNATGTAPSIDKIVVSRA